MSPYIVVRSVDSDNLIEALEDAIRRGVRVAVVIDLDANEGGRNEVEAIGEH